MIFDKKVTNQSDYCINSTPFPFTSFRLIAVLHERLCMDEHISRVFVPRPHTKTSTHTHTIYAPFALHDAELQDSSAENAGSLSMCSRRVDIAGDFLQRSDQPCLDLNMF